jgi:hypothetical protein
MKLNIIDARFSDETAARSYRVAGLLIAVGVPTLFWTFALTLVSHALGVVLGGAAFIGFTASVAGWSLIGSSLVMIRPSNTG